MKRWNRWETGLCIGVILHVIGHTIASAWLYFY
jgi:hypothetical protein